MKKCCCTIASINYLPQAIVATNSLRQFVPELDTFILVADEVNLARQRSFLSDHNWLSVEDVSCNTAVLRYRGNSLRWALKPFLMSKLLETHSQVIYIDNDIFCLSTPTELLNGLNSSGIVLTPHRRRMSPDGDLPFIMSDGYFNAGIIGATKTGKHAIEWWKKACLWKCPEVPTDGLFSDQRYLDILYIHFQNICQIIQNPGYNLASWNLPQHPVNGQLLINDKWPIVMAHLTKTRRNNDNLQSLYEEYDNRVSAIRSEFLKHGIEPEPISKEWGVFTDEGQGPLNGRLWTKDTGERMLRLYQQGKVQGHVANHTYKLKNIKELLSSLPAV